MPRHCRHGHIRQRERQIRHRPIIYLVAPIDPLAGSVGLFLDAFANANRLSRAAYFAGIDDGEDRRMFDLRKVVRRGEALPDSEIADLVIVAASVPAPDGAPQEDADLTAWIRRQHRGGALVAASGSSILYMAAAGLLDGRKVAVPWWAREVLLARHPRVKPDMRTSFSEIESDRLAAAYPRDDLALAVALIARLSNPHFAEWIAHETGLGGTAGFDPAGGIALQTGSDGDLVHGIRQLLRASIARPMAIENIARRFGVSVRTLNRRFLAVTGTTPSDYLQKERVAVARRMLFRTDYLIERIAGLVGYSDPHSFSKIFRRHVGISPKQWRFQARLDPELTRDMDRDPA